MRKILLLFAFLSLIFPSFAQNPWKIDINKVNSDGYYGETVANGILGMVSSYEPLQVKTTILAGSYDKFGRGEVSNFLEGFNFLNTHLYINGIKVSYNNVINYSQSLDMRKAAFTGLFERKGEARVSYNLRSLRQLPYSALIVIDIEPLKDITIKAANILHLPNGFNNGKTRFQTINDRGTIIPLMSMEADSPTGRLHVAACSDILFPTDNNKPELNIHKENNEISQEFTLPLKKGEHYRFAVVGSTISSATNPDPINEVKRLTTICQLNGLDNLIETHEAQWADLWKSNIIIEGDKQSQQDVHSMMYHLYAFLREGSRMSISPMGLSGLGYNGHVFWDADTWMFPALLLLHPEMAKSMLDYRYDRLEAARHNAALHGFRGAMYPWESADTGFEETPVSALTGTYEHHITGCVGFAAWQYFCVTKDEQWLREEGWPMLSATADFWLSRVTKGNDGLYHINNVVGADEYAQNIDDNAFTNGVARANLMCAAKAARQLGLQPNPGWEDVAAKIKFINKDGITIEHATYQGEEVKQADPNLLAFPLKQITDRKQILADIEYYSKRVPLKDTPAMTQAMFALMYARLGMADKAWHYFQDAYKPNLLPPFGVIAECKGGDNPYFITGAGGVLQSVLMGFGGIDINLDATGIMQTQSVLPKHWKKLTLTNIGPDRKTYTVSQ
ncbi:MAG: glycoside hydrolase family 65 protein [Prevotella sp.]|jgi:trehalose/maltose hydrolase-like predicted phosphorylase